MLDQTIGEILNMVFPSDESPPWDSKRHYKRETVSVYAILNQVIPFDKSKDLGKRARKVKMSETSTISKLLSHAEYVVPGIPVLYVVSERYKEVFLKHEIAELGKA